MKTNYTYDLLGNVTSVSIGSISGETAHTYRYEYDLPGNLTKRIDSADKMYYYEYNDSGLLTKSTDANGVVTEYSYDVLGRKTSIQNSIDPEITYSYNVFGELVRIQQGEKYIEYTYDSLGNKTTENNGLTLDEYTYDERGNITQHKSTDVAAGAVVTGYEYNALNLPVLVRTGMGIQTIEYDKAGRIIRSQNSNTGAEKTTVYDGRGLIKRTQTAIGDRIIFSEKNWYDSVGNKIFTEEDGEEHEYRYDGMNRLIYAKTPGSEIYYEFDGFGNISHEDISTPLFMHTKDYFYDADNRLTMIKDGDDFIDYGYDNAGNVTDINTGSKHTYFRYDGFGRLISADDGKDITAYTYSPDGRRDSKITNGNKTRFVYDGRNVSAEILPDGNMYTYYRADEIIGSKDSFGNELYYMQNTHGDVIKITDIFGMTIKDYKYSPYGKEETFRFDSSTNNPWILQWKAETTKIHNPFRYAGEYFDEETGFIYLRNRYYDTESSRFVSEDPIRDGLNWYAYCGGNPITFVDPLGLKPIPLRETIESLGGTVIWNAKKAYATVKLDNKTLKVSSGDRYGNYINSSSGKMFTDDEWLFSALAVTFDITKGWKGRIERNTSGVNFGKKHIHIYNGKLSYSQNEDGSPHDDSTSSPPNKIKKYLKENKNWDWDAKEKEWIDKISIELYDDGIYRITYPNGRKVQVKPYAPLGSNYSPSIEELRRYYAGPTEINLNTSFTNDTTIVPLPTTPNAPVNTPIPIPAY